ncbi:hypothetical protein C8Q77DRAFT_138473 [Trametes polyzona]|nr:hypothetical protein C8Q77DRAFT_138473 [Trametes polyzona]
MWLGTGTCPINIHLEARTTQKTDRAGRSPNRWSRNPLRPYLPQGKQDNDTPRISSTDSRGGSSSQMLPSTSSSLARRGRHRVLTLHEAIYYLKDRGSPSSATIIQAVSLTARGHVPQRPPGSPLSAHLHILDPPFLTTVLTLSFRET